MNIKAFTLAEVLITLGIIGVVASMTLPTLVGHYKKVEASSRLKKFVSSMEQAVRLSEVDNGDSKEWYKAETQYDEDGDVDYDAQNKVSKEFFMTYLAPYFKYTSITDGKNTVDDEGNKDGTFTAVHLADGSSFKFNNGSCMDFQYDVNGDKKPNSFGRDRFVFLLCFTKEKRMEHFGNNRQAFGAYKTGQQYDKSREKCLRDCKSSGYWCSGLLEIDNWEFKEDYPYKL